MENSVIDRLYEAYKVSRTVTTDSRAITPGCLFFAFKGASFDGNAFAGQALEKGAALCVMDNAEYATDERCIVVDDVLKTLQALALHHRKQLTIPVVGITGTNGKTTTKELVAAVLERRYRVHATRGNFNNHLGVPLTLLSIPEDCEIAVVEMGANHPGEIEDLCNIALPTCGLITSVGLAHLEGFGSFEGVVKTKTELYRHIAAKGGKLYVNADNERLVKEAKKLESQPATVTYGTASSADLRGTITSSDPYLHFYIEHSDNVYTIAMNLIGSYNFTNAMAAAAVGLDFNIDLFEIKEALENYQPENKRSQYKRTEHNALILDCYNANPTSMKAAVESFAHDQLENKIVFLGGMKELGDASDEEHKKLFGLVRSCDFKDIYLVGEEFGFAAANPDVQWFPTSEEAVKFLQEHPIIDANILIKGSNSTKMWLLEEVL